MPSPTTFDLLLLTVPELANLARQAVEAGRNDWRDWPEWIERQPFFRRLLGEPELGRRQSEVREELRRLHRDALPGTMKATAGIVNGPIGTRRHTSGVKR